jgi:hypothetical protein
MSDGANADLIMQAAISHPIDDNRSIFCYPMLMKPCYCDVAGSSMTIATAAAASSSSSSSHKVVSNVPQLLSCGVLGGFIQAAAFNPWDRALYLSVINNRPFLHPQNFVHPFSGVIQTITQRGLSAGLYFPLEEIYRDYVRYYLDKNASYRPFINFIAGMLAGTTNGLLMNPLSYIKYHYWGKAECGKENVFSTAADMYRRGGSSMFFVGTSATIYRDFIFGGIFSIMRHDLLTHVKRDQPRSKDNKINRFNIFLADLVSACTATVASSPFNYVRDMHYSTPPDQQVLPIKKQIWKLWEESCQQKTAREQLVLLLRKLRIGWGTARVGCGMASGSFLYSLCSSASL